MSVFRIINTVEDLVAATQDRMARYLILRNDLTDVPSLRLMPFQSLSGEFDGKKISFQKGAEGFCLSKGNELKNLVIETDPDKRAIFQDQEMESMNNHHLTRLSVTGQISFIVTDKTRKGHIDASFVHVKEANTAQIPDRPNRFGVDMMQGAFTIWNKSENHMEIEVDISHFSCGSETKPILGSGLVICGTEEQMGHVRVNVLSCGHIYTKGEIGKGVADLVCAGIGIGYQTLVRHMNIYGRITCYGGNEMGIYNWGTIERASMTDRIETHGANGCGFINAGNIGTFNFMHEIETYGTGARGFYMFDGAAKDLHFDRIVTHGNAANAIQFNRYIDRISISKGIEVFGNALNVLFADTIVKTSSDAICIQPGGTVRMLKVSGDLISHGNDVCTIFNEAAIEKLLVSGKVLATGEKSTALEVKNGYFGAENVEFVSEKWVAIEVENAKINNCRNLKAHGKDFDLLIDILSSVDRNIFTTEFLDGIFQPGVRIEYRDNLHHSKEEAPEEVAKKTPTLDVTDITPDKKEDSEAHPMACKAPTDIKPIDESK
ncbi:MAG: hypothetical protein RR212_06560 [Bacteroidales bacterium]